VIGLLFAPVSPVAQALADRFSVNLNVVDVGWPASASIAFGSQVGALIIPFCLLLNVVFCSCGSPGPSTSARPSSWARPSVCCDDPRADSIAIMVLLPRRVAILMEGLVRVSEAARTFMQCFPGRRYYIGQPAVIATSLIRVPVTLLVAVALEPLGNRLLRLVDLATIPFIVAVMVAIFRGNIVGSLIGGAIAIDGGLFIATALASTFPQVAADSGFKNRSRSCCTSGTSSGDERARARQG
jgi:galactitol-specific phosphotransferase system IIC component